MREEKANRDNKKKPVRNDPSSRRNVGSARGMAAFGWMLHWFPRFLVYWIALLPVVYYYIKRREVRATSPGYQKHLGLRKGPVGRFLFGLKQAAAFSRVILDNMYLGFSGRDRFKLNFTATSIFRTALERGRGLIVLSAHVGNWHLAVNFLGRTGAKAHVVTEDIRAPEVRKHMDAAKRRAIDLEIHDAGEGPELVFRLSDALRKGEVVVLSGDRSYGGREMMIDFMGDPAPFPVLGFSLARITGAPLCVGLAFSNGMQSYDFVGTGPLNDLVEEGLAREQSDRRMAELFADYLAENVKRFPEQWFNFIDFWRDAAPPASKRHQEPA